MQELNQNNKSNLHSTPNSSQPAESEKPKYPTETISLVSKGLIYPEGHPLAAGEVEMKYMTAREEDILTSQNLINKGLVIDRLLQSLIVSPKFEFNDLYSGDENGLMFAARILGYGKDYEVGIVCPHCGEKSEMTIDLQILEEKKVDYEILNRANEFKFTLPFTHREVTFKLPTQGMERKIEDDKRITKKLDKFKEVKSEVTNRLKYMITSVDGETDPKYIRNFVDNELLSRDLMELRKYIDKISPDIDTDVVFECGECNKESIITVPMTVKFFWPNARI